MKILHIITNTELGGAQKVCIDLCRSAVADGNSVAVASMDGGYLWSQLPSEVEHFKLKHMVKPIKLKKDLKVFFELKAVIKRFKPDIIHLHSSKAGVLGRLVAFPHYKRVVYTVHGFDSIRLKYRVFLPLEKILQHFCGGIVGVSDYDNKNLHNEKIKKNVSTVYNGIDEKSVQIAHSFPVKTDKRIVMTIARISPPKKIQMFLDVAEKLHDYQFIWFGGSPEYSTDELFSIYKIPENVNILGDVPNASSYIHFCDLFVLFSNFEGLPMTIIEAMSQKKAIVASNVGGIYELVDDSNGCLIENDVDSACNAIKKILEDSELRKSMEEKSYEKFKNNFTLEKMWTGYKSIYEKLNKK
mgnify:CR=1 FL=1